MELTTIKFEKANLEIEMEKNSNSSYSISIREKSEPGESLNPEIVSFRTDEIEIDNLIESLKFCQSYNFIQE